MVENGSNRIKPVAVGVSGREQGARQGGCGPNLDSCEFSYDRTARRRPRTCASSSTLSNTLSEGLLGEALDKVLDEEGEASDIRRTARKPEVANAVSQQAPTSRRRLRCEGIAAQRAAASIVAATVSVAVAAAKPPPGKRDACRYDAAAAAAQSRKRYLLILNPKRLTPQPPPLPRTQVSRGIGTDLESGENQ